MHIALTDRKEYCMKLYHELLSQYEDRDYLFRLHFSKEEKDILLLILQKAKPDVARKTLRRKVVEDVKAIQDKSLQEFRRERRLAESDEEIWFGSDVEVSQC